MEQNRQGMGGLLRHNSLFSNSLFIFIIRLFPSLANLVVIVWYSRQLPQDVYGQYQSFWIQMNVIYPFICFGIHVLVTTYSRELVQHLLTSIKTKYYIFYGIWILLLSSVFAALQYYTHQSSFIIPLLFIVCFSLSIILESLLIVFKSYKSLALISVLYSVSYCYAHVYILDHGFSLQALFTALLIIAATRLLLYGILFARQFSLNDNQSYTGSLDVAKVRSLWLHLGFYDALQVLFNWIDKFIISLVLIAPLSAIYFTGSQTIPVLPILLGAAGSAVLVQLATGSEENETADIIRLMNRTGKALSCIVFPVFCYLFFYRAELFTVIFPKYTAAIPIFGISVLVLPVRAYSFTTVLQRLHKGSVINAGAITDIVLACALMYPFYLWLGLPGVALSFVVSTYLQATFYLLYSAKLLKVSALQLVPYANWFLKLIVFAFVLIGIRYLGRVYFHHEITLILGGAAMCILVIVSLLTELTKQKHGDI